MPAAVEAAHLKLCPTCVIRGRAVVGPNFWSASTADFFSVRPGNHPRSGASHQAATQAGWRVLACCCAVDQTCELAHSVLI